MEEKKSEKKREKEVIWWFAVCVSEYALGKWCVIDKAEFKHGLQLLFCNFFLLVNGYLWLDGKLHYRQLQFNQFKAELVDRDGIKQLHSEVHVLIETRTGSFVFCFLLQIKRQKNRKRKKRLGKRTWNNKTKNKKPEYQGHSG